MGNDLRLAHASPAALISSPDLKQLRRISLGTVQWPGQPLRRHLSGGSTLTDSERTRAKEILAALESHTQATGDVRQEQFGLIARMLLTYPVANATAESGAARGAAYLEAVEDIPPHVLASAIKLWNRGEAGDHDYRWAPAPAVLRSVCAKVCKPYLEAIEDLTNLLSAVSIDRAMDPTPIEQERRVPALRRMA